MLCQPAISLILTEKIQTPKTKHCYNIKVKQLLLTNSPNQKTWEAWIVWQERIWYYIYRLDKKWISRLHLNYTNSTTTFLIRVCRWFANNICSSFWTSNHMDIHRTFSSLPQSHRCKIQPISGRCKDTSSWVITIAFITSNISKFFDFSTGSRYSYDWWAISSESNF